ncbi:MAG: ankyrin repeat domain-containing protein [Gammaproteobacteria bacterium]|nr:ankyrin repeat domain-containing protein [Gammaproteobacteria bacterium]
MSLEADIAAALDSDDATRLRVVVSSVDWSRQDAAFANRILQRIARHGCSGRTERYCDLIDEALAAGVVPSLSTCALLRANDLAERILADTPLAVRETDENGATPLHHAAERGNATLAARLCALGAPLDVVDARGETPLAKASHAGPWKNEPAVAVVELLRKYGAAIDLFALAAMGDADGLATALGGGASANKADQYGRTLLFIAAHNNRLEAVRVLLGGGADPNVAAQDGQTPLSTACLHTLSQECDTEIVRLLVGNGAPMTIEAAIVLEDLQAIRGFVASDGAMLDGQDHESALGYAIHAWHPASLRCLIQSGARPNAENWQHIERIAGADAALVAELKQLAKSTEQHE